MPPRIDDDATINHKLELFSSQLVTLETKCENIPTNTTPPLRLFLQESDKPEDWSFFMPQEYVWSDLN